VRTVPIDINILLIQDYLKPLSKNDAKTMIQLVEIISNYHSNLVITYTKGSLDPINLGCIMLCVHTAHDNMDLINNYEKHVDLNADA